MTELGQLFTVRKKGVPKEALVSHRQRRIVVRDSLLSYPLADSTHQRHVGADGVERNEACQSPQDS
jgi:hypothetical protein